MIKLSRLIIIIASMGLFACDNEVDLTAEFEDTTVVYSLLNAREDTHFVKINKAFIEDGANAIELAKETDRLFYDNLEVTISGPNQSFLLNTIEKPKAPGIFSNEKNIVYYTDGNLLESVTYNLQIKQPDGKISSASVKTLQEPGVVRPRFRPSSGTYSQISFVSDLGGIIDYEFEITMKSEMTKAQLNMIFIYDEVISGNKFRRYVDIPIGIINNSELKDDLFSIIYKGESFFQRIAAVVPDNGFKKEVPLLDNITLYVTTVDAVYSQYTDIYGPLDGLAQVRPEYTNVTNGIGLVASRSNKQIVTNISSPTRAMLFNGPITGGLNFADPS